MPRLDRIAGGCPDGNTCPTISTTDRGTVAVQGYTFPDEELAEIGAPPGETVVEIPMSLIEEAARALRR
jgi:hypothetical protein